MRNCYERCCSENMKVYKTKKLTILKSNKRVFKKEGLFQNFYLQQKENKYS